LATIVVAGKRLAQGRKWRLIGDPIEAGQITKLPGVKSVSFGG